MPAVLFAPAFNHDTLNVGSHDIAVLYPWREITNSGVESGITQAAFQIVEVRAHYFVTQVAAIVCVIVHDIFLVEAVAANLGYQLGIEFPVTFYLWDFGLYVKVELLCPPAGFCGVTAGVVLGLHGLLEMTVYGEVVSQAFLVLFQVADTLGKLL